MIDQEEDEKQAPLAGSLADPVLSNLDDRVVGSLKKLLVDQRSEEITKVYTDKFLDHIQDSLALTGVRGWYHLQNIVFQHTFCAGVRWLKSWVGSRVLSVFRLP
jgi:hypothetical protein